MTELNFTFFQGIFFCCHGDDIFSMINPKMRKILFSIIAIITLIAPPTPSHAATEQVCPDLGSIGISGNIYCSLNGNVLHIYSNKEGSSFDNIYAIGCNSNEIFVDCAGGDLRPPTQTIGSICSGDGGKDGDDIPPNTKIGRCVKNTCDELMQKLPYSNYKPQQCEGHTPSKIGGTWKFHSETSNTIIYNECTCTYTSDTTTGQETTCHSTADPANNNNWNNNCQITACGGGYCVPQTGTACTQTTSGTYSPAGDTKCQDCPEYTNASPAGATDKSQCYTDMAGITFSDKIGGFTLPISQTATHFTTVSN